MTGLVNALTAITIILSPSAPYPDPAPAPTDPSIQLLPTYTTNGNGTRMQCSPTSSFCWPDTTGLPSYLTGA